MLKYELFQLYQIFLTVSISSIRIVLATNIRIVKKTHFAQQFIALHSSAFHRVHFIIQLGLKYKSLPVSYAPEASRSPVLVWSPGLGYQWPRATQEIQSSLRRPLRGQASFVLAVQSKHESKRAETFRVL